MLLGPVAAAFAAPTVSGLEVRPPHFSPDGDGSQDSTEVLFTPVSAETDVTVDVSVVRVSDGSTFAVLLAGAVRPAGTEVRVGWNPGPVAEGRYRFQVDLVDAGGSVSASAEVTVDTTDPVVDLRDLSRNPFDPQVADLSLKVDVTSDSTTVTTITCEQAGAVVDSLGTATGPGTRTFVWDGLRAAGGNAPPGRYDLVARAVDLAGNRASDVQTVTLDRNAPLFRPGHADTVGTTSFPLALAGIAVDEDRVTQVTVSFDSAKAFVPVDFQSAPDDTVQYQVNVLDPAPQPGRRLVVLRAVDAFGHVTDREIVVLYDTFFPAVVSTRLLDEDGMVADGDSLIVETVWGTAGLTVRADLSDLDSGTAQQVSDEGGGRYLIRHRVVPTNTRSPGSRRIVVTASTGFLVTADTLQVTLVDRHRDDLVSVDRNRFDPLAGDRVTIAGTVLNRAIKVEIYELSGRRVRLLEGTGYVEWDGRNEEGSGVASGVYLLHVRFGDSEEVRKVAVLRGGGR